MKILTNIFLKDLFLLILYSTTAYSQPLEKSNEMLESIRSVAGLIIRAVASWYPYLYDGRIGELADAIRTGGNNMFDNGNLVSFGTSIDNLTLTKYNQTYPRDGYQFSSISDYPFIAVMWIDGTLEIPRNYTLRVQGVAGGDGLGSVKTIGNKNFNIGLFNVKYNVFQIYGAESPTIAKVFFTISSRELWNSVPEDGFSFDAERTANNDIITVATLTGTPMRVLFGYMLLSNFPTFELSQNEIDSIMSIITKSLGKIKQFFTDDCREGRHDCHNNAICIDKGGSFTCVCRNGYVGNGKECFQDMLEVGCYSDHMTVQVPARIFEIQDIDLDDLHLRDYFCRGKVLDGSPNTWIFDIPFFSSCGTVLEMKEDNRLKYSNTLTNIRADGRVDGTGYSRTFSCVVEPQEDISTTRAPINLPEPGSNDLVSVKTNLYTDDSFSSVENKKEFKESDYLHVKFDLESNLESDNLVIKKCWATPNAGSTDVPSFTLIENRCPTEEAKKVVQIIQSGDGNSASFESRVFSLVDFPSVYIHCTLYICSSNFGKSCKSRCNEKRSIADISSKFKRELPADGGEGTVLLGPFFREPDQRTGLTEVGLALILIAIVGVILALLAFAFFWFRGSSRQPGVKEIDVVTFTSKSASRD